ncbi:MAG: IclR family transcriptional regulator [Geobacteraceae bacterium GWC2_58_44]|nr:MAG: IclR family transcriptional regulator [Geobacteraceae bacterium GWC2_58_44]HBG07805.1 IclR family transcriptional regulator [Geobacter sp.]
MAKEKKVGARAGHEKTMQLLEMLADEKQDCSVSALSRRAGISRYKMTGLLASLESKGVVECAVESGQCDEGCAVLLGRKLLEHADRLGPDRSLLESFPRRHNEAMYQAIVVDARPVIESLALQHNEAMYLTILKGDEVLFLDMVDCRWQVKAEPLVGKRFPFFSNAAGKVMRAIDSWDLLEKIAKRWRRGQLRFPDLAGFRAELETIRETGVAVDCGGMGEGIITVAVAVRDYAGKVVGALTMLGPSFRLLGERLEQEIIPSLLLSGELLSMKFGYVGRDGGRGQQ